MLCAHFFVNRFHPRVQERRGQIEAGKEARLGSNDEIRTGRQSGERFVRGEYADVQTEADERVYRRVVAVRRRRPNNAPAVHHFDQTGLEQL